MSSEKRSEKLSVNERLILMQLLNKEDSIIHVKIMHDFRQKVSFSNEELQELNFQTDEQTGAVRWNFQEKDKSFEIGKVVRKLIKRNLKELDDEKKITTDHITLWEKFVGKIELDED